MNKKFLLERLEQLPEDIEIHLFGYVTPEGSEVKFESKIQNSKYYITEGLVEFLQKLIIFVVYVVALQFFYSWYGFEKAVFLGLTFLLGVFVYLIYDKDSK